MEIFDTTFKILKIQEPSLTGFRRVNIANPDGEFFFAVTKSNALEVGQDLVTKGVRFPSGNTSYDFAQHGFEQFTQLDYCLGLSLIVVSGFQILGNTFFSKKVTKELFELDIKSQTE